MTENEVRHCCREYFECFLPTLRDRLLIPNLRGLSCIFAIDVTDLDGPLWLLVVEEGRLTRVGGEGDPACTFVTDAKTVMAVVTGVQSPQEAFFAFAVDVQGDMELGLKLSTVLEPFFRRFPYKVPV